MARDITPKSWQEIENGLGLIGQVLEQYQKSPNKTAAEKIKKIFDEKIFDETRLTFGFNMTSKGENEKSLSKKAKEQKIIADNQEYYQVIEALVSQIVDKDHEMGMNMAFNYYELYYDFTHRMAPIIMNGIDMIKDPDTKFGFINQRRHIIETPFETKKAFSEQLLSKMANTLFEIKTDPNESAYNVKFLNKSWIYHHLPENDPRRFKIETVLETDILNAENLDYTQVKMAFYHGVRMDKNNPLKERLMAKAYQGFDTLGVNDRYYIAEANMPYYSQNRDDFKKEMLKHAVDALTSPKCTVSNRCEKALIICRHQEDNKHKDTYKLLYGQVLDFAANQLDNWDDLGTGFEEQRQNRGYHLKEIHGFAKDYDQNGHAYQKTKEIIDKKAEKQAEQQRKTQQAVEENKKTTMSVNNFLDKFPTNKKCEKPKF